MEYNKILTGLTNDVSGLRERRPSAGRRLLATSIVADMDELMPVLKSEVLDRVSREIVLDADEGIDYASRAEALQALQPVVLKNPADDEEEPCAQLNERLEALTDLLFSIADALDRHYKDEDYIKLYDDEVRMFNKRHGRKKAKRSYERWREKECLGKPTMEDLEDYRAEKLMELFKTGMFDEDVATRRRAKHYADEVVFQVSENDDQLSAKNIHKYYYCLRTICDYDDQGLKTIPLQAGIHFYTHRQHPAAAEYRKAFVECMAAVGLVQQEMVEMRKRREMRLSELSDSRRGILERLAELAGYGEWVAPATPEKIVEMLNNVLGVGMYELTGEEAAMSKVMWSMLEQTGNLRVVWQNLIGYFAEHRFFTDTLGAPALNDMFFSNTDYYQNIDKGRPSYTRKSKKWAQVQPLLDRFVPRVSHWGQDTL